MISKGIVPRMSQMQRKKATPAQRRKSLIASVVEKEKRIPYEEKAPGMFMPNNNPNAEYYNYFARHYFENKTIDPKMISQLRKGAKMLSVGVDAGHLEKTLLALSIPVENIDVADIDINPLIRNTKFKKYEFDASEEWLNFEHKYNYIVFPESLLYLGASYDVNIALSNAIHNLEPKGEIRIASANLDNYLNRHYWSRVLQYTVHEFPNIKIKINEEGSIILKT